MLDKMEAIEHVVMSSCKKSTKYSIIEYIVLCKAGSFFTKENLDKLMEGN